MILMPQIFDVTANENARYKRNELELRFWLRITDEGLVLEMHIWSISLIKSDLKWCIHLSISLYSYFNYLVIVTAGGPESPREHM